MTNLRVKSIASICNNPKENRVVARIVEIAYDGNPLEDGLYWGRCDESGELDPSSLVGPFDLQYDVEESCKRVLEAEALNKVVAGKLLAGVVSGVLSSQGSP